jgi:16S rRNA (guanine527-N7)-methyltransferase
VFQNDLAAALDVDKAIALGLVNVSRETLQRLNLLLDRLLDAQQRMNLVAPSTLPHVWTRHVADSLQLLPLVPDARVFVDLGSGAGFPGLALACALAETAGTAVHLVESNLKKAAFLQDSVEILKVPALVHPQQIREFTTNWVGKADVVTARALAPLAKLLDLAFPLLKKGAQGLFPKGQGVEAELTEAAKYWRLDADLVPSATDSRSRVLVVRKAERRRSLKS